jgi:N-acetylneuraminate synthase
MTVFIIAEAGVNHNGEANKAFQLIDIASKAKADAIKFQTFKAEDLVTRFADTANYQKKATKEKSQLEMLKKLELPKKLHFELSDYARENSIEFMSTAFDSDSLKFLTNELGVRKLKVSSGDITNEPFLLEHARTNLEIILSTGVSTIAEIKQALSVIAFGLISNKKENIKRQEFSEAYSSIEGQDALQSKLTVLHCTSQYPAPSNELNLNAIKTIKETFGVSVGYSDHSVDCSAHILAVALGVTVYEKHFTINKCLEGPDHKASIDPLELSSMVSSIRDAERLLGNGIKHQTVSELENKNIIRKSLCAKQDISSGQIYTYENIAVKRPGRGMPPSKIWDILGKKASFDLKEGEYINE